jgi:y4mF family transcriptional regulator
MMEINEDSPASLLTPTQILGRAVRRQRQALKLTQAELAQLAGCGVAFLYLLETGKPTVRMDKVLAVLGVLGLELRLARGRAVLVVEEPL